MSLHYLLPMSLHRTGGWSFATYLGSPFLTWEQALAAKPDALMAPVRDPERFEWVRHHFPFYVNYSGAMQHADMIGAISDDRRVGLEAVEHLGRIGVRSVTCLMDNSTDSGKVRREGFQEGLASEKTWVEPFSIPGLLATPQSWERELKALRAWLKSLPRSCGLFVTHNSLASLVMQLCQEEGLRIPQDLALLWVSHHGASHVFLPVRLSYVPLDGKKVGVTCADMLDRQLRGEALDQTLMHIPPLPVLVEQSTAYARVKDPLIAIALQRLEDDLRTTQSVEDLMRDIPLSRRAFEMRFRLVTGLSPRAELERVRIEKVKQLLIRTTYSLQDIAERVGFTDARHISISFRRCVGVPPMAYRRGKRQEVVDSSDEQKSPAT